MTQKAVETKNQPPRSSNPSAETKRLNIFVGEWNVEGKSYAEGSSNQNLQVSSVEMKFVQTCEWLLGRILSDESLGRSRRKIGI